jgi:hypothetical protein
VFKLIFERANFFFEMLDLSFKTFLFFEINRKFRAKLLYKIFERNIGGQIIVREREEG